MVASIFITKVNAGSANVVHGVNTLSILLRQIDFIGDYFK